ncbi:MAG: trigger factor [Chloroflexales bacterium]|nr:trigger factor [Chloroflexales bacterium]
MKVTTEKLPKSLLALDIELRPDQVEKGLNRAARRLSQKYNIPGFRKGKAPPFIIENYFGRAALMEEASEDLINKAFKQALQQEQITPVGQATIESVESDEPFRFRVLVPVAPTTTLPDYRAIQIPLEIEPISDEMVQRAMESLQDKHAVLKELEEPRPIQLHDQLTVQLESFVDGEPLEQRSDDDEETPETTLIVEPERLVDELYQGLLGAQVGDQLDITAQMPDDHANEKVQGKEVVFKVKILGMQERLLPDWEELPVLEEFEGSLDELREKTLNELEETSRSLAERKLLDDYIDQLVAGSTFDIPDVLIQDQAESLLQNQARQFAQYGITLEQMLQYRGQTHDKAVNELLPEAENQVKITLALRHIVQQEELDISDGEINAEMQRIVQTYQEDERGNVAQLLNNQLRANIANVVLDRKLRLRLIEIATGTTPTLPEKETNGHSDSAPGQEVDQSVAQPETADNDQPGALGDQAEPANEESAVSTSQRSTDA